MVVRTTPDEPLYVVRGTAATTTGNRAGGSMFSVTCLAAKRPLLSRAGGTEGGGTLSAMESPRCEPSLNSRMADCTKAVVAILVLLSLSAGVGAVGFPENAGEDKGAG